MIYAQRTTATLTKMSPITKYTYTMIMPQFSQLRFDTSNSCLSMLSEQALYFIKTGIPPEEIKEKEYKKREFEEIFVKEEL